MANNKGRRLAVVGGSESRVTYGADSIRHTSQDELIFALALMRVTISGPPPLPVPCAWAKDIHDYLTMLTAGGKTTATAGTRRHHLGRIARAFGATPQHLTGEQLVAWFGAQTHWSSETRRSYRNTARSFFDWAQKAGRIATNPADTLPAVKPSKPAPRPVPDTAYATALDRADPRTTAMLRLATEAGLRRAEVAQVHTDDVTYSMSGPQLLVHGKGNKARIVPITDELAEMIMAGAPGHTPERAAFGAESGYLFPGDDDGHLSPRWVGTLCARALPGIWTMHKCRHRFAAKVYRGSRNLRALQVLLGHESVATTEIYTPVDDDEIRAAMLSAVA